MVCPFMRCSTDQVLRLLRGVRPTTAQRRNAHPGFARVRVGRQRFFLKSPLVSSRLFPYELRWLHRLAIAPPIDPPGETCVMSPAALSAS
ncbi:hypothetical protein PAESOLCIP111_05269 [Paenibacillus solanacearum]|uniref:Uncharacterized protein n=1 Tax=Paenibacillus solanacearum TaxID=2048548 RepID=A0A916K5T3_9BACL|nr:hypothetical protein PAESOLCIP111_05269 [Paenibacillus solanacearum]